MDKVWKPRAVEELSKYELKALRRLNRSSFIDSSRSYDGVNCRRFLGSTSRGYGYMRFLGNMVCVHRISASLFFDFDISSSLDICHHCDVKNCWEPTHLFPGTQADNSRDAAAKGISSRASHNGHKTHCPQGHEYTPENTRINQGSRVCIECDRQRKRVYYHELVGRPLNG